MTKKKKIIIFLSILIVTICIVGVTFGIETFFKDREQQEEQLHKQNEMNIVVDIAKRYKGIKSVKFTYVEPSKVIGGYTYSFYVNDESPNKNGDSLWSYSLLDDKSIGGSSYPRSGEYAFKKDDTPSDLTRERALRKADISNIKINYRIKADK
ncbi:hypothetical protein [Companilactobacillus mishanensis]|uniref:DUF1433 domain-containing protein n=1 Tax=Companilactobacillus mishanensis TaxID=2486008 RepID=A0A5P0ZKH5_9LACO|nr:hypothetical protein [Companilactobacillus mishanensis]MQS53558.1 hypothetical protein [Companilactobacillus mishanensis]